MKLAMLPPTLFIYFLMMRPALTRSLYSDGGPSVAVGTATAQRRHFPTLSHLKESKDQEAKSSGNNQLLNIAANAVDSASKEEDEEAAEDFEDSDFFDFPQFSKRQYDDYGHLRFGKRNPTFDDYGHMRFGKRNLIDDYGHLRFGKRSNTNNNNNNNGGGGNNDEDYGHLRFGRQAD